MQRLSNARGWPLFVSMLLACQVRESSHERNSVGTSGADSAPAPASSAETLVATQAWRALGTEPFWALDIDSTGLRFRTPDDTIGIRWPPLKPLLTVDTLRWIRENEGTAIDASIWPTRCSDGMSDRVWPYTAMVRIDSTSYRGCADSKARVAEN